MVTVGSQMALDLVTRIFCDPGDVILAEAPSYVGALGVFQAYQAQVVHVAMDDDGLMPDALVAAIETTRAAGRRIKFLYTIPNFHNPAGVTLSEDRRGRDRRDLPAGRHPHPGGQPLRAAGFRRQAAPGHPRRRCRECDLSRLLLQDLRPGPAGGLGTGPARGPGEAGPGQRGRHAESAGIQPDADLPISGDLRLARPDQGIPADLQRTPRHHARPRSRSRCRKAPPGLIPTAASMSG